MYEYKSTLGAWEHFSDLNEPAFNPCLTNFSDKYLIKINGMKQLNQLAPCVEIYNIETNLWDVVITNELYISIGPQACQINDNEILVLGGKL